jgi:hypothetical protein
VNRREAKRLAYGLAADVVDAARDGQDFVYLTDDLDLSPEDECRVRDALLEIHDQLARFAGKPPGTPTPVDPNQASLFETGDDA